MNHIAFIIPYFTQGRHLPDYFPLWLKTAGWNTGFDFLIFTDAADEITDKPDNVTVIPTSWPDMQVRVRSHFDFDVRIETPYKLCDYRPAYGEIFQDELAGYDFWGHCDIDLFWGNLSLFITENILNDYDRIYTRGHCSLYRNNPYMNSAYRVLPEKGLQSWKDVYSTDENRCFDEWGSHMGGGMSSIMSENGIKMYGNIDCTDIKPDSGYFYPVARDYGGRNLCFRVNKDGCYAYDQSRDEVIEQAAYVHFQKRKLRINVNSGVSEFYLCAPNNVSDRIVADRFGAAGYKFLTRISALLK